MKREELVKIATELNTVMSLDPAINTKAKDQVLIDKIMEAGEMIDPDLDDLSKPTIRGLKELGAWPFEPSPEDEEPEGGEEGDFEDDEPEPKPEKVYRKYAAKATPAPAPAKAEKVKKEEKVLKPNRTKYVCAVLMVAAGETISELAKKADAAHVVAGAEPNEIQTARLLGCILPAAVEFGIVKVVDGRVTAQ